MNPFLKSNFSYLISFILLMGLSTCKKEKKPVTYKFNLGEAKDYLWAEAGSYWIYKNTKTGDLDTQTCLGISLDTFITKGTEGYSKNVTIEYEKLSRGIRSSFNKWIESQNTISPSANANDPSVDRVILQRNASSVNACFFYPFNVEDHTGNGSSYTSYIGMDSTLTLQGKTYNNVAKFSIDKDDIWEHDKLNCIRSNNIYYWAKDVGLIKKEMKTCNSSWELIEYNIVR